MAKKFNLVVQALPAELGRGISIVTAVKQITVKDWITALLYRSIDEELRGYPEWRIHTDRPQNNISQDESE